MQYYVSNIERKDSQSYIVYARQKGALPMEPPELFLVQKDGDLLSEAQNAFSRYQYWDVPLERFTQSKNVPNMREELVTIDLESILRKAINTATKAHFSDVNNLFADYCTDDELLDGANGYIDDNNKMYEATIVTLKNGRIFQHHEIKPLYAEDDDDALKVALSVLSQRERRDVREEDLMTCNIKCISTSIKNAGMLISDQKLSFKQESLSPLLRFRHPDQYRMYLEVKTFEGGNLSVSKEKMKIKKRDGTTFETSLSHYESDMLTETYVGTLNDGQKFRFLMASESNPMKDFDPFVSFASISTSGWAVHYHINT